MNWIRECFGKWEIIGVQHFRDCSYGQPGVSCTRLTFRHSITGRVRDQPIYGAGFLDKSLADDWKSRNLEMGGKANGK